MPLRAGGSKVAFDVLVDGFPEQGRQLNGPPTEVRHPGNANLRFDGYDGRDLLDRLQPRLAASTGAACASGMTESSHVLRALGRSSEETDASVRFSFARFTTDAEIELAAALVLDALEECVFGPRSGDP